jgi:hypothetical protein
VEAVTEEVASPAAPSPEDWALAAAATAQEEVDTLRPPAGAPTEPAASPDRTDQAESRAVHYYLDRVEGDVEMARAGSERWWPAKAGVPVPTGSRLRTRRSLARVAFHSGSAICVNHWTTVTFASDAPTYGLALVAGEVYAEVTPADRGFAIETPHGRAVDLGTRFGVKTTAGGTTVVVVDGTVEASTDVGTVRLASDQEVLLARRTSPPGKVGEARDLDRRLSWVRGPSGSDETLLVPARAKVTGWRWRIVRDPDTSTGVALEARDAATWPRDGGSYATFTFDADAGKSYYVWVRGRCIAGAEPKWAHDAAGVELVRGGFVQKCQHLGKWGGNWFLADGLKVERYTWTPGGVARFARSGRQVMRLHPLETPIRIDCIWISPHKRERPEPEELGPSKGRPATQEAR